MASKDKKHKNGSDAEPPSLFDNLDLFSAQDLSAAKETPKTLFPAKSGLTGSGPMRELFDYNFRQYSAFVI